MASSSGSSYTFSQETTNFARICRIVVEVLRDILWQVLIHEIPAADLPSRVRMNQKKLAKLDAKINTWLCGISPSSSEIPIAEKFDVTSLYTLIRNLCSQVPAPSTQWGKTPPPGGTMLGDDIERVREFRNSHYGHVRQAKIDTADFSNLCIEIRNVVSRFDVYFSSKAMKCDFESEIDIILTCSMDKSLQDIYIDKMKEIAILSDDLEKVKLKVGDVEIRVSNVQEQVSDTKQQMSNVQEQFVDVKHQFSNVQEQVVDVKHQFSNIQEQFVDVKQQVSNVQEQVVDVKHQFSNVLEQVVDVKQQVSNVQEQVVNVKPQVSNVQEQVVDVKHRVVDVEQRVGNVNQQVGDVECQVNVLKEQFVQHVMEQAHFSKECKENAKQKDIEDLNNLLCKTDANIAGILEILKKKPDGVEENKIGRQEIEEIKETLTKKPDVVEKSKHFRKGISCTDPRLLCQILSKSVQVASSSLSTLKENCLTMGMKFHGVTPRNGNCFFEAVSSQLQRLNCTVQMSAQQLRKDVVAFMKTNRLLCVSEGTIDLAEFIHDENFDDYCARISRDGEWADHVVVLGMARMIQTDILIITSSPSSDPDSNIAWVVGQANFQGDPILLGHEFEQHYQSLQPIENLQTNEFGLESDGSKEAINLEKIPSQSVQVGEQTSTVKTAVSSVLEGYSDTEADEEVIPEEILRMDEGSIQMFKEALRDRKEKVYNIRVMIVGGYGVGKTTLSKRLLGDDVNISERESIEGIDVLIHHCRVSWETGEWLKQDKDAEEAYKVQRNVKLLNDQSQGLDISDEQTGNSKVTHQMETPLHVKEVDIQHVRSGNLGKDQKTLKSSSKRSNASDEDRNSDEDTNTLKTSSKGDKENSFGNIVKEDIDKMLEQSARNAAKSDDKETVKNILKFVTENADKLIRSREEHSPLAIWDLAEQYIYYTTHQTFQSQRAIYLLVIDLTQGITDRVEDDEYFFDIEGKKECKVHDLAELWLNSIHSCAPSLESGNPPVILVGTHADKITKETCEDIFLEIRNHYLKGRPASFHLADEDFSIDNTFVDPKLKDLRKKIVELASQQQHWGESIPARWLILEERLMGLKANDVKVIPYHFLEEMNQEGDVRIESKEELDLFLKFQHDIGNILYFSTKDLREWIILEPQWLIKAMKSLITADMFILRKHPQAAKEWHLFKEEGKLTHELLDIIWNKDPDLYHYKTLILLLMEQLNIIARPRFFTEEGDKVENFFLAPFMLREKTPRDVISPATNPEVQSSSVLCFVFVEKFLPSPIFHQLLAVCVAKWPILKKRGSNQIFCGCGVFEINRLHRLTLYFKSYAIFARVTLAAAKHQLLDSKVCIQVRKFINDNLFKILRNLSQNLEYELFIQCQCPESDGHTLDSMFHVKELYSTASVTCHYHDDRNVETNILLNYWFQNEEHKEMYSDIPAEILHMDEKSILLYREALRSGQVQINNLRIMVVGQYGVGKTTLTKRLLGKEVYISEEKSTEGIEIYKHCCKVSLDKGEWIVQHEDVEQYSRLQCLVKLFNESVQKHKASVEQKIQRKMAGQSAGKDQTGHRAETIIYQQKETSNVLPTSQETGSFIVEVDNKHAGQKTNTSTISLGETMSSKSEMNDAVVKIHDLIKLINKKLAKSNVEYAALTIWDFAGQYVYYTTHQIFLTSRALYLLVINLSQQVTNATEGDKVFLDTEGIKQCTVYDMIEIWLNTIHFCAPSPKSGIPPVILVGTHVDKIPEKSRQEVIDKYFKSVYRLLGVKPIIIHLKGDIAIDNNLCDANPGLEELKRKIFELAKTQPHWGEKRPARWIPMEQAIMALKHSGSKVVARSLLADINRRDSVGIDDRDELDLFLKFHHEIGTILYFSVDELKENIILEPQWVIDALKSLITADTLIRKNPAITSKWDEFNEKGKLTQDLLDAVWSEENNPEFHQHKDFIVKLMEKLNILAKPLSQKDGKGAQVENYFLAPCMLKVATPVEFISPIPKESVENTSVLCYVFRENFLPPPIFHRLIAACVAQWPIARNGSENLIYCGCCVYQLDSHHRLTLFFREHVIFVRVTSMGTVEKNQSYKLCIEAKEFITSNLSNVIRHLGRSVQFQLYIRCPKSEGYSVESLVPVADLQTNVDIPCYSHGNGGHLIISCQVLKFWFQEVRQPVIRSKEDENQPKGSNQESPIPRKQSRKDTAQQKRRLHCDKDRPASTKRNQAKKRTLLHESSSDLSSDSESEIVASSDSESGSEDEVVSHTCKRKTKTKKWKKLKKKQKRRNMQDIPKNIFNNFNIGTVMNSNIVPGDSSLNSINVSTQKDGVKLSSGTQRQRTDRMSSSLSEESSGVPEDS